MVRQCAVDPSIIHLTESKFDTIDGRDLSVKFTRHMKGPHVRTNRPKLRALLVNGLDVRWGKRIRSYMITPTGIVAKFNDGTTVEGTLLVSCEGAVSEGKFPFWILKLGYLLYFPLLSPLPTPRESWRPSLPALRCDSCCPKTPTLGSRSSPQNRPSHVPEYQSRY